MRNAEIGMRNSVEFGAWSVEFRHRGAENALNLFCIRGS